MTSGKSTALLIGLLVVIGAGILLFTRLRPDTPGVSPEEKSEAGAPRDPRLDRGEVGQASDGLPARKPLPTGEPSATLQTTTRATTMKLTSTAFAHTAAIPPKYTCDEENVSPPLTVADIPAGVKSLALIVDDPDAPRGDFVHWTLWNIPPTTTTIPEGTVPPGSVQGTTDFGSAGYGGPCPPLGTHHYQFKLYALDTALSLDPSARKADIERAIEGHILDQTLLVGTYVRQ